MLNASTRDDEIDVILSIYGDAVNITGQVNDTKLVSYRDDLMTAKFLLPKGYPVTSPVIEWRLFNGKKGKEFQEQIDADIAKMFADNIGTEVLFQTIEYLRTNGSEADESLKNAIIQNESDEDENAEVESEEFRYEPASSRDAMTRLESGIPIIHGEITMERKSTFQAHMARVKSVDDVNAFRSELLSDKRIARATHNIFAYRFTCAKTGAIYHDCDDDGESAAGAKLAEVLRLMSADGVAVIVSRWYGGVKLGPSRFKFINNAARNVLESNGFGTTNG